MAPTVFRVGLLSPPHNLDIRRAPDGITSLLLTQTCQSPLWLRSPLTPPEAQLITRPEETAPGVLTASIRPATFSNGVPLTEAIVVNSLRNTPSVTQFASVDAQDGITFTLKRPNARFSLLLATTFSSIVLEDGGQFLGTGPYMFEMPPDPAKLRTTNRYRLVRNPHVARKRGPDEMEFLVFSDAMQLIEALKDRRIDYTDALSPSAFEQLRVMNVDAKMRLGTSTGFVFFNTDRPALRDPAVRRAFAQGIDRFIIAKEFYGDESVRYSANSMFSSAFGRSGNFLLYSVRDAERQRAELGAKMPKTLELLVPWTARPYAPDPARIATLLEAQFATFGVLVTTVHPSTSDGYYDRIYSGDYDLVLGGWIPDTPDPADFYEAILSSKMIMTKTNDAGVNFSRIRSPQIDEAIAAFRLHPNTITQAAIDALINNTVPFVPLLYGVTTSAVGPRVATFRPPLVGAPSFDLVDLVAE